MEVKTRQEWGARYGRGNDVSRNEPMGEVVIHTEAGAIRDQDWPEIEAWAALNISLSERQHIQAIENFHVKTRGWNGVGYSFLVTRDGTIFEGRGWGRSGAHTETRNSTAIGVCFLGHGDKQPATGAQWAAVKWLIGEGIRLGHLKPNPKITGHRNYSQKGKSCPGNLIYPHIGQLRGITGPVDIGNKEFVMDDEVRAEFNRIHKRLDTMQGAIVGSVWSDEATDVAHQEENKKQYGSIRGWIVAMAKRAGVTREEAMENDPSSPSYKGSD